MKRLIVSTLAAGAFALAPCAAEAQIGFGLNGGVSLPMGDYGDDDLDNGDAGGATTGFSVFLDLGLSIPALPVGWTISGGITSHGVDDAFGEALVEGGATDVDVGRYYAVPVLTGPRIDLPMTPGLGLYVDAQAGLAMFRGPDVEWSGGDSEMDWSTGFAWSVGAGIDLPVLFGLGVRYVSLGDADIDIEFSDGSEFSGELPVSWVDVFVSIGM